ncbi:MAG: hypothetical protein KAX38_06995 [Candidatus Krumholzibacteria bacterium]|nr:hypothetical protein [Candidatus Krumholzibacteria bacterium]
MKRFMYFIVFLITICLSYGTSKSQSISVFYDCNEIPGPWNICGTGDILGPGEYQHLLEINDGILEMNIPDAEQWVLLEYVSPTIAQSTNIYIEASVKINSHNNKRFSPLIGLCSFDPSRHYSNRAVLWYLLDLYPDRVEFLRIDHYEGGYDITILGSYPVIDLSDIFHKFTLFKHEEGTREFIIYMDNVPIIEVFNESFEVPLNAVEIGYGAASGVGISEWDYINFETSAPVSTDQSTWGDIKDQFKK